MDVKVDSEQDERPERDGKDSGQHGLSRLDVREVVVGRRDDQPDHKEDDSDEADPQLDPPAGHEHDDPKKWHLVSAVRSKFAPVAADLLLTGARIPKRQVFGVEGAQAAQNSDLPLCRRPKSGFAPVSDEPAPEDRKWISGQLFRLGPVRVGEG